MIKKASKTLIGLCVVSLVMMVDFRNFVLAEQRFIDHGNGTVTRRDVGKGR